jgi:hypothetical protein
VVVGGLGAEAILDTGASRSSIDRAFAAAAGIPTHGRFTGQMIQGRVPGAYARDVVIRIGEALVRAEGAVAVDYGQLSRELGRPVQVVLGRELFESLVVDLDVDAALAAFAPRQAFMPPAGTRPIALRPARGRMTAPIMVEDLPLWANVDIGNDLPLIVSPSPAARRLLQGRPVSTALIGGPAGQRPPAGFRQRLARRRPVPGGPAAARLRGQSRPSGPAKVQADAGFRRPPDVGGAGA